MATSFVEATAALTNEASTIYAANPGRRGLVVANASDTVMTVRFGGTASATVGIPIGAGTALEFRDQRACPGALVSVFCAGTAKTYTAYEW